MDDKKIFKIVVLYLKSNAIKVGRIEVPYYGTFDSLSYVKIQDDDTNRRIDILPEFEKWLDNYIEDFDTDFFNNDYNDNGGLIFTIDVEKLTMSVEGYYYEMTSDTTGMETSFDDLDEKYKEKLSEYFKNGVRDIVVEYSGGGDSGQIDYMYINGENTPLDGIIEDISYGLLSNFGGWEINEGSQGNITFNMNDKTIYVEHEWNNEKLVTDEIETINLV